MKCLRRTLVAALVLTLTGVAVAQPYPSRPVRLVVPFPPGGGFDGIARPFAERLATALGQAVIVDNRAGAGGNIGTEAVTKSPADGYTLLFANDYLGTNPNLYKGLRYDPVKDLEPVTMVGSTQLVIAVSPTRVKATQLAAFQAESQARPLQYGTPGVGTSPHLFGELYGFESGARVQHVPYRGTGPALTDAIGGQIDFALVTVPAVVPHVKSGKLRAIAVAGGTGRSPLLPDVPTLAESGLRGVNHDVWYGLFAPAGTPPDVLRKLREASLLALSEPGLVQSLASAGYQVTTGTPEQLRDRLKADLAKWKRVVERAAIQID